MYCGVMMLWRVELMVIGHVAHHHRRDKGHWILHRSWRNLVKIPIDFDVGQHHREPQCAIVERLVTTEGPGTPSMCSSEGVRSGRR